MVKEKIVMRIASNRKQEAFKIAARLPGVSSVAIEGENIVVIGDGVDVIKLLKRIRNKTGFMTGFFKKNTGFASLVSVEKVKGKKKKKEKKERIISSVDGMNHWLQQPYALRTLTVTASDASDSTVIACDASDAITVQNHSVDRSTERSKMNHLRSTRRKQRSLVSPTAPSPFLPMTSPPPPPLLHYQTPPPIRACTPVSERIRAYVQKIVQKTSQKQRKSLKAWSVVATTHFLRCAVEAYELVGVGNKKRIYKRITIALNKALKEYPTETEVTDEQVKHKYDALREQWIVWQSLCSKTGAGWDSTLGTVSGSNEWWADRVKEFGTVILKYQSAPIENMELLHIIYSGTHATGAAAFTSPVSEASTSSPPLSQTYHMSFDPNLEFDSMCRNLEDVRVQETQFFPILTQNAMPSSSTTSSFMPPPYTTPSFIPPPYTTLSFIPPPSTTQSSMSPPSTTQQGWGSRTKSRATLSRKRRDKENTMKRKIRGLLDDIHERRIKKSRSSTESPTPSPNSVESTSSSTSFGEIASRLKSIGGLNVGEALSILVDKEKREMFNALDDDTTRYWMTIEIFRMKHEIQYQQYLINKFNTTP